MKGNWFAWSRGCTGALAMACVATALVACNNGDSAERYPADICVYRLPDLGRPADVAPPPPGQCEQRCATNLPGGAFRFTMLHVTAPADGECTKAQALRELLNGIWTRDLAAYVLNIIFEMKTVQFPVSCVAGSLELEAGPGWYKLKPESEALTIPEVTSEAVESLCLLQAPNGSQFASTFQATLDSGCAFNIDLSAQAESGEGVFLLFHTGPVDAPIICAPEQGDDPAEGLLDNTIPLAITFASGKLNEACDAIEEGFLEGCIALDHADHICFCIDPNYNCPLAPNPASTRYCDQMCAPGRINFGAFVTDTAGCEPACTVLGKPGVRIAGNFRAERIPDAMFDRQRSINCRQ